MLSRYLFSMALWADRPSPRTTWPPPFCFPLFVLIREIATFSRSTSRTGIVAGTTVADTPLLTGVGVVTLLDAGGDVVMTMLAVPDESAVPANCDWSSNYRGKHTTEWQAKNCPFLLLTDSHFSPTLCNAILLGPNYKKNLMTILWLTNIITQTYDKVMIVPNYKRILW